jgi:predicted PurR-regulated permease PerM
MADGAAKSGDGVSGPADPAGTVPRPASGSTPQEPQTTEPDATPGRGGDWGRQQTWFLGIIAFGVILFLLVQARFVLISLAIAIILFSLTSDVITTVGRFRIGRLRIPPGLASVVALLMIASGLLALSALVLSQANTVVQTVLLYAEPTQLAVARLFWWLGDDAERAVLASVQQVRIGDYLRTAAGQAGNVLSATVLIILFVGFLFAERIWFGAKLTNLLVGDTERAARIERIIGSIIHRVNRYLLVKTLISAMTGLLAYGVARAFGLDLAAPIGVLTFVLNYIPNVGSIVATVAGTLVGYVQTGDVVLTLGLLAALTAVQFALGQVLDPLLLGRALRLSSFGIIISLAFWAAVWGIPGMFLAVPIMVAVMIVCSHIPGLRAVAVLLSREGLPDMELRVLDDRASARIRAAMLTRREPD